MAATRTRVGGSGFTTFNIDGKPVLFMKQISITWPKPVQAAKAIQPIDAPYPVEIATVSAVTEGTLGVQVTDWYNEEFWQRLATYLSDKRTIQDVLNEMLTREMTCSQIIKSPDGGGRVRMFFGCKITDMGGGAGGAGEMVQLNTVDIDKNFTIMYTHYDIQ